MNEELTNDEVEIDLVDLGYVLLDKWRYLLISLIAGAVLLGAYSFFFIAPTYESTAKLYVVSASDDSVVKVSNHQFNWWFILGPPKGHCYCSPQRAVSQALLLARYKAVLLESSLLDSSACSFIYF